MSALLTASASVGLADWLTAGGTVGAVIAAVGLQAWITLRVRRHRPRLELALDQYHYTTEANSSGEAIPYLRIAVHNAPGKDTAHDVEILVESVVEKGASGVRRWLVNPALGWPNSLEPLPRMTIPPGVTRYLDVGFWIGRGRAIAFGEAARRFTLEQLTFVLDVKPTPFSLRHLLEPGQYEITLSVAARNADATTWALRLSFEEWLPGSGGDPAKPRNLESVISRNGDGPV